MKTICLGLCSFFGFFAVAALPAAPVPSAPDTLRLSLRQAMEAARTGSFKARLALSQTRVMAEKTEEARGALMPQFGATASDVRRSFDLPALMGQPFQGFPDLVGPFNAEDARLNGRISLLNAPAWERYRAAQADQASSGLDARAARDDAATMAAAAYLSLERARALIQARTLEVAMAQRLDTLTRAQKRAGAANQVDVLRAQGQLSSVQSMLDAATGQEEQARYTLLRVLGAPLTAYPVLADTLSLETPQAADSVDDLLPGAVAARPEVAAADQHAEAARAQLSAAKYDWFPTLDLYGDYGLSGLQFSANAKWTETIALQLNWNLWQGGQREARIGEQREKVHEADLERRDARTGVEEDIRAAAAGMRSARDQAVHALDRARYADEEARLAEERFRSGESGNLEVITAQGSVSLAHEAAIDAVYTYNRARLEFFRAANRLADF